MALRVASSRKGLGASSITFWWRRWMEHSRSHKYTQLPCASPNTWISMWRGSSTNFSMNTRSSPKLLRASLRHDVNPSNASPSLKATRKPLPPPPALALIITG